MAAKVPQRPRQAPKGAAAPRAAEGHNSEAVEEADRIQLISIISKLSQADEEIELARVPLKAAQDKRKTIIGLGKAAGWTAAELKARLDEMRVPSREMAERAERERKHRRWLGIIEPEQADLMTGVSAPQEAKDEAHWKAEGFKAGLRQQSSTPPNECPERFVQAFMKEHERGLKEVLTENVPGKSRLAQQAEAEFKEDNPEVDLDAAAKALKASNFMVTDATDEGFEATPEELAAQAGRPDRSEEVV